MYLPLCYALPTASPEPVSAGGARSLLLAHQLPAKPAYLRVKVRRRLRAEATRVATLDFFGADGREAAEEAAGRLGGAASGGNDDDGTSAS